MMLLKPPPKFDKVPNTIVIISTTRHDKFIGCDVYIDVASFMVDDWDFRYNGQEPIIQNTLYNHHSEFFISLSSLLLKMNLESGLVVVLVCEAGERRSVASAELLARELRLSTDRAIKVYHKELSKWMHLKF